VAQASRSIRVSATEQHGEPHRIAERDLSEAIAAGTFRSDLFYRLNVFPIAVPPLRKRHEDIPILVEYFVKRFAEKMAKRIRRIEAALAKSRGRVAGPRGAAARLGIPPSTLESKIEQLKIEKSQFTTAS
jgi:transcriptional regulator with GAF, ATPase, and Fis domain